MYPKADLGRVLTVALVITGDLNSRHTRISFRDGSKMLPLWRKHVVDVIEAANARNSVHSFVCTSLSRAQSQGEQPDWSFLQGRRGDVVMVPEGFYWDPELKMDQYSRMESCFLAAWGFERQAAAAWRAFEAALDANPLTPYAQMHNATQKDQDRLYLIRDAGIDPKRPSRARRLQLQFTHYVRARPDLEFHERIPLSAFDPQFVVVRARAVLLANECDVVHADALVIRAAGKSGRCGWKAQYTTSMSAGKHPNLDMVRRLMRKNRIPACGALDDMFGVAPGHLGPAFFLRQAALEAHVPPQLLPYGWNLTQNAARVTAVKTSYGTSMSYADFYGTCINAKIPSLFGAGNASMALRRIAERNIQAEAHITVRATARMLPFRFSGLPFSGVNAEPVMGIRQTR